MASPERITILHVSDFHFSAKRKRDQEMVVRALLDDLKTLCIGHRKPDIVVFGGDLTQAPPSDSHAEAYDFLLEPLQKVTNTSHERMFIVPGNHDVERDAIDNFLDSHLTWQSQSNNLDEINAAYDAGNFTTAHKAKFDSYLELEDYLSKSSLVFQNIFCAVYHIEALNTDVVIFNSSILSTGGHKSFDRDEGKMVISEFAVAEAMDKLKPGSFRIFTTHHPLEVFSESGRAFMTRMVERNANLFLFGHMHDPTSKHIVGFEGNVFSNQAGAIFTHRKDYYIGYGLICIEKEKGYYEAILRSYYPDRNCFDDAIDKVRGGRFYNSQDARQYWRSLSSPVDDAAFRKQLSGPAYNSVVAELVELGVLDAGGRQNFVAPRLNKIEVASSKENAARFDTPLPFEKLVTDPANFIVYSPQEYGRTTVLRELQLELLAKAESHELARLPIMISFDEVAQNAAHLTRVVKSRSHMDSQVIDTEVLLRLGSVCLLIDDVDFSDRRRMAIIRDFISAFPKCRYILSSLKSSAAPYGAHVVPEVPVRFEFVELCELKRKEMRQLIKLKLANSGDVEAILDRLHSEISGINLPFTAANGTILMTIYEQNSNFRPINRSVVIEQFVDATLRKSSADQSQRETFDYSNKTALLAHVAGWMAKENCYTPQFERFRGAMKAYVDKVGLVADLDLLAAEFFEARIMRRQSDGGVAFRYRAVLEYFIAIQMIAEPDFKLWVLDDSRYLSFINEIQYYAGKIRNDAKVVDLISERFARNIDEVAEILGTPFDPAQLATLELPRKGDSASLSQLSTHLMGQPLSREERDEALEAEIPRDDEDRQVVFRPRIEHPGHKLLVGLLLFSGLVKNMETIDSSDKQRHLRLAWKGWSLMLKSSLSLVEELAKHRQMRINGVLYEIHAPRAMPNEELGRQIALVMPTSITRLISAAMGTEKLQLQLTEPELDDSGEPLVYEFLRSCLIADLKLPVTPSVLKNLIKKLAASEYLSEALIWKIIELRKMDQISSQHFEALQSDVAGAIVRLHGGKPSDLHRDKSKQIEKLRRESLMLKIARQKEEV
ncbi:putative MPP superfamily phosphohydrolase [Mycoplana sp. BE70]|uniref:metallophosphoesterase n=1 Tax=Mycoplana sp. BE70 TaxID=2817775 RepID=UPI0028679814|nr:metallophosphoesterase [Mycoplana sp. BE70]MDR6755404.1 putative MPP superfamily phosphohydrolase [Mycoplana sp. BE70]